MKVVSVPFCNNQLGTKYHQEDELGDTSLHFPDKKKQLHSYPWIKITQGRFKNPIKSL